MARGAVKIRKAAGGAGHVSARSKTGDPQCSQAMSDWKTHGMTSAVAAILGKCRAKAHAQKQAQMHRAAGNEAKAQVLEHRAATGVVGKQARLQRARELMAGRKQRASASALKPTTRAMLGQRKAVNSGGERPDGLATSKTIRAMKSEPMANTPSGYQVHAHTQQRASELASARSRKARQLRDQRKPPTPAEARHRRYHRLEGEVFRGTGGGAKAVQVSGTHHTDADFAQRVQARRDAAAKALKSVRAQRQNQTPAVERRLLDAKGQGRLFAAPGRGTPERLARAQGIRAGRKMLSGAERQAFVERARATSSRAKVKTGHEAIPARPAAAGTTPPDRLARARQLTAARKSGDRERYLDTRREAMAAHGQRELEQAKAALPKVTPELESKVASAFTRLNAKGDNFVHMRDLRRALPDVPKPHLDAAILKGRQEGRYAMDSHEGLVGVSTRSQRRAGIYQQQSPGKRLEYLSARDEGAVKALAAKRAAAPKAPGRGTPERVATASELRFAHGVKAAARSVGAEGRFHDKAYISHVHKAYAATPAGKGTSLETFKQRLVNAQAKGHVELSRADMVSAMHPGDVKASATTRLNSEYHFVTLPSGKTTAAPHPAVEKARAAVAKHAKAQGRGTAERLERARAVREARKGGTARIEAGTVGIQGKWMVGHNDHKIDPSLEGRFARIRDPWDARTVRGILRRRETGGWSIEHAKVKTDPFPQVRNGKITLPTVQSHSHARRWARGDIVKIHGQPYRIAAEKRLDVMSREFRVEPTSEEKYAARPGRIHLGSAREFAAEDVGSARQIGTEWLHIKKLERSTFQGAAGTGHNYYGVGHFVPAEKAAKINAVHMKQKQVRDLESSLRVATGSESMATAEHIEHLRRELTKAKKAAGIKP